MMEEKRYRQLVADTYKTLEKAFDTVDPDVVELTRAGDVITLLFADGMRCILSPQPPLRQLWVAARASAVRSIDLSAPAPHTPLRFADGSRLLFGNDAVNSLTGTAGRDHLAGFGGVDTLDGGTGADVMAGGLHNDVFMVDSSGDVVIELEGGGSNDRLRARHRPDRLRQ